MFLEVPIGNKGFGDWPLKSKVRRIDGVRLIDGTASEISKVYSSKDYTLKGFFELCAGKTVELIEVKKNLNRLVIGQIIAGVDMFERQYQADKIIPVIFCQNGVPALEWVCEKRDIKVHIIKYINP